MLMFDALLQFETEGRTKVSVKKNSVKLAQYLLPAMTIQRRKKKDAILHFDTTAHRLPLAIYKSINSLR